MSQSVHVGSSLKELEMCTAKVSSLCIYQTPLQQGSMQVLGTLSHHFHFLMVEVSAIVHPKQGDLKKGLKIRAEKTGLDENGKNSDIHVKEIQLVSEGTQRYFTDTHNVSIPMRELLKILTSYCEDYDILNDNSWLYADATLRYLVRKFRSIKSSVWFKSSYMSSPSYFHPGSEHVASSLKELEMCTARVSSLCIYETPLQQGPLQALGIFSHDFLVVEVSAIVHPEQGDLKKWFKIRAEKTGRDENGKNTGIHVKEIHLLSEGSTQIYSIDTYNVSIQMGVLLEILTKHCADYDILNNNCWLYADNTLRALVQKFRELQPELGGAMNDSLQQIPCPPMPGKVAIAGALATVATAAVATVAKACLARP